ncbi:MAG: nucleotidyltransferase domain-containing protein [Polyangiales bacterium]
MPARLVLDAVHDFARRLRERFGDRTVWVRLYGSQARGEAHEDSDIDVIAAVRGLTWREKIDGIDLATDVGLARGLHLSAVIMSEEDFARLVALESSFAEAVLREGIAA